MKRATLLVLLTLAACRTTPSAPTRLVDLTHAYDETTIYWPTAEGFRLTIDSKGWKEAGFYYEANSFCTAEHGGTHLDAPIHFAEGRRSVDEIPLTDLIGPGIVVDVRSACAADRDYQVTTADLLTWESTHGPIPTGAIVLLHTGFGAFWPDRERYMGTAARGPEALPDLHFPGLHPDAARWLATQRSIAAVGLDTPSIDHGPTTTFPTHVTLFDSNIPALENVANLHLLPPRNFELIALPMKIRQGSGAPTRIIARLP